MRKKYEKTVRGAFSDLGNSGYQYGVPMDFYYNKNNSLNAVCPVLIFRFSEVNRTFVCNR